MKKLVYIAGKYNGDKFDDVQKHIDLAREVSIKVWEHGGVAFCPHLNTAHFQLHAPHILETDIMEGCILLLSRCDAIFMMSNWKDSKGAKEEYEFAKKNSIPILDSLDKLYIFLNNEETHRDEFTGYVRGNVLLQNGVYCSRSSYIKYTEMLNYYTKKFLILPKL